MFSKNTGANRMLLKKSGSNNDTNNVTFFLKIMQWRRLRITSSYSTKVTKMFFHCQKEDATLKVVIHDLLILINKERSV